MVVRINAIKAHFMFYKPLMRFMEQEHLILGNILLKYVLKKKNSQTMDHETRAINKAD